MLWIQAEQLVARNTVRAYTICLDMTITQANYWLVYRRLANNLMFSRHGCPHRPETPSFANTHTQAEGGGGGIERKDGEPEAKTPTPSTWLTDTPNKLSFKLMFLFFPPSSSHHPSPSRFSYFFFLFIATLLLSSSVFPFFCLCARRRACPSNRCRQSTNRKPSWPNSTPLNQSEQQHPGFLATNWGRRTLAIYTAVDPELSSFDKSCTYPATAVNVMHQVLYIETKPNESTAIHQTFTLIS